MDRSETVRGAAGDSVSKSGCLGLDGGGRGGVLPEGDRSVGSRTSSSAWDADREGSGGCREEPIHGRKQSAMREGSLREKATSGYGCNVKEVNEVSVAPWYFDGDVTHRGTRVTATATGCLGQLGPTSRSHLDLPEGHCA